MKKKSLALIAILILCFIMTACGKAKYADNPCVGTWTATTADYSDYNISVEIEELFPGGFIFVLEDTGKCTVKVSGDEESGKWSPTDNGFNVEGEFDFVVDGSNATLDYDGIVINFVQG
ncbi:MAG: hypothetical protein KBS83_05340 [Lachnospiraceae bacterium]|nr:hypothetical protein [Candidatus Equihabitans merdae]